MTLLNRSTRRRLKNLRQHPCVWEGDRYPLQSQSDDHSGLDESTAIGGDCILWVDGATGTVRAMEMVSADVGQEAVVRGLLRAMEHPSGQMEPARPKKIVVRNRELQFFLRGILQELDIEISYAESLPLIDEIFQGLQSFISGTQPRLPAEYADALQKAAITIWNDAPWEKLDEEKIIEICLNEQDVEPLYLSFLGMLGVEFGVLMYRSKASLKAFRQKVLELDDSSHELLEEAFLQQDCLFLTFEPSSAAPAPSSKRESTQKQPQLVALAPSYSVQPEFGNLHPLEGMRPNLYQEEALIVLVSLQALHLFWQDHAQSLHPDDFPMLSGQYSVLVPTVSEQVVANHEGPIEVMISTLPDFAQELASMVDNSLAGSADRMILPGFESPVISSETIPPGTMSQVGCIPWDTLDVLRLSTKCHQPAEENVPKQSEGFPIILLQTSRPKAMKLIESIQSLGGLKSIGFIPGEDQWGELSYDLGVIQTQNNVFHVFMEYDGHDAIHQQAREKWDKRCQKTAGYCGLIIAKGVTGAAKGNPSLKDMVALFEVRSLTPEELGFGMLRLLPNLEPN